MQQEFAKMEQIFWQSFFKEHRLSEKQLILSEKNHQKTPKKDKKANISNEIVDIENPIYRISQKIENNQLKYQVTGNKEAIEKIEVNIENSFLVMQIKEGEKTTQEIKNADNQQKPLKDKETQNNLKNFNFYYATTIDKKYQNITPIINKNGENLTITFEEKSPQKQ